MKHCVDYKALYLHLFNAATDALREMEAWNFGRAKSRLMQAQCAAEEQILSCGEDSPEKR